MFGRAVVKIYPFATLYWANKDENVFQQIFLVHGTINFPQLLKMFFVWNYTFSDPTGIHLSECSSNNGGIMCEIYSKLTIEAPGLILVFLFFTLSIFDTFCFCWCWTMLDVILYCLKLNVSMHFRVTSRGPITSKTKLSVTKVSNSSQQLPLFDTESSIAPS